MSKVLGNIVEVEDVERSYCTMGTQGEKMTYPVLKGISFKVKAGEFLGIMGTSGCGKTTLLRTLGMLDLPDKGAVLYKGISTRKIYGDNLAKIRRTELAFVFQDFYLMDSLSVKENIMLPLILNEDNPLKGEKDVRRVANLFGIGALLDKKPYELSGGEKQRTAICRAMVANPELILADEPTGNLDSNSSMQVVKALAYINRKLGKTIVLVTHDPKVASYCHKIIFLKDGEILDTVDNKGEHKEFYQKIMKMMIRL